MVIVGAVAELERNLIIERVKSGMRRAKLEGRHICEEYGRVSLLPAWSGCAHRPSRDRQA
jgi:hypothetical protein